MTPLLFYGERKVSLLLHCAARKEKYMPLIQLVIVLVVVGVILGVINRYIPMQSTIKKILNVVVIIVVIVWLLSVFGFIDKLSTIRIGK
jgi:uncharacterized membrane protein YfcA